MNLIQSLVLVLHVLTAIAVIGFVLLQHGKGADMGAAFGSGSSGSVFGSAGSANFLSRTTAILATVFFATSVALTWFGARAHAPQGVMEGGVMERAVQPAKPSAVPQPATGANAAGANAGGANAGGTPADSVLPVPAGAVPASAPASTGAPPAAAPGDGEVPK